MVPTGVYTRTKEHRKKNSEGHKNYFKNNPEARRNISKAVMRYHDKKKHELKK